MLNIFKAIQHKEKIHKEKKLNKNSTNRQLKSVIEFVEKFCHQMSVNK